MTQQGIPKPISRKLPELDGLRGILALWVLGYHVLSISGWWSKLPRALQAFGDGANAVDVFILLSGFVITGLLLSKPEPYLVFLFRRYARLMPVFAVCLAAALAAQALGYMPVRYAASNLPPLIIANVALLHGAIPANWIHGAAGAILNPAWSISLEWQFYLLAPTLVASLSRGGVRFLAASAFCILLYRFVAPNILEFSAAFLPLKIHLFWIGMISSLAYRWYSADPDRLETARSIALAILAAVILLLPYAQNVGFLIWSVVAVMLTGELKPLWRLLGTRFAVALGAISYPLYLVHEIIIWSLLRVFSAQTIFGVVLLFLLSLASSLLFAWMSHILIEEPAISGAKKLFRAV